MSEPSDRISVRIGKQRKQRMISLCQSTGLSISRLTQQAIDRELQRIASEILQDAAAPDGECRGTSQEE